MTESKIPVHSDLKELEFECDELGVTLTCFFEWEPEERGAREYGTGLQLEPDYPETFTLMHVYTPEGLDISSVMKYELIDEIEKWAADRIEEERRMDAEDAAENAAYDRYMDSRGGY